MLCAMIGWQVFRGLDPSDLSMCWGVLGQDNNVLFFFFYKIFRVFVEKNPWNLKKSIEKVFHPSLWVFKQYSKMHKVWKFSAFVHYILVVHYVVISFSVQNETPTRVIDNVQKEKMRKFATKIVPNGPYHLNGE